MARKHIKSFQAEQYRVADDRIARCGYIAILAFKGFYYNLQRDHKRLKLI
jgi:hypothetical protein